jgi:cytosine/adenosine deaminase-related metal-dependent hydrolase
VLDECEKEIIRRTGTGICTCPSSNMYTAAGVCAVAPMLQRGGVKIGLGVDGSATNDSSHMLKEVRNLLFMQRAFFGADAMSATQALEIGILGGAQVLCRNDIGVLAPGKRADLIGIDLRKLRYAGAVHDPLAALVFLEVDRVDLSIVDGRLRVLGGQLIGTDLAALLKRHDALAVDLVRRAERRHGISVSPTVWRRAFPCDPIAEQGGLR